jgi:endo-1,4-beta-xylanase
VVSPPAGTTLSTVVSPPQSTSTSIDAKFKLHGKKYIGVATDQGRLQSGSNAQIIQQRFGQVSPENSMKWDAIERESFFKP